MHHFLIGLTHTLGWAGSVFVVLLALAIYLSTVGGTWATRTPGLDVVVSLFTWAPWVIGGVFGGKSGLVGAVLAEPLVLVVWAFWHEAMHQQAARGPRIVKFINRTVGRWQNHVALWVTAVALPGFLGIRLIELVCWPPLIWLLKFPKYDQTVWINVSRQKFTGLIGHDLIWCLYCDWMTGVYSLGAEMLRNVESFWCPIRYYDGPKCDKCSVEFPDINGGWVKADGTMANVEQTMQTFYGEGNRTWFGHESRVKLTVKGEAIEGGEAGS